MSTELTVHGVSHIEAIKRHFPKDGARVKVRQFTLVELTLHTHEGIVSIKMFPGMASATLQGLTITNEEKGT